MPDFDRGRDGRSTATPSGGGVPAWLGRSLNHCSNCGSTLRFGQVDGEDRDRLACTLCGHIAYVNPRLVVTALPVTDDGRLLLLRRGIEPGLGLWAQPGGFMEIDETVNQAAMREAWEETRLRIEPGEIIGLYTRLEAAIVTIVFEARIVGGSPTLTAEALEIETFRPEDIPWADIAFSTTTWALRDWLTLRRPDVRWPDRIAGH